MERSINYNKIKWLQILKEAKLAITDAGKYAVNAGGLPISLRRNGTIWIYQKITRTTLS
jgi:hypothetical protein